MAINLNQRVVQASKGRMKTEDREIKKEKKGDSTIIEEPVVIQKRDDTHNVVERVRKRSRSNPSDSIDIQIDIKSIMGFDTFNSTKNKHVVGIDCYGVNLNQKVEYRQYMNRQGGFNRPLSPTRGDKKEKSKQAKIKLSLKKENI